MAVQDQTNTQLKDELSKLQKQLKNQQQLQEELELNEERFRLFFDNAPIGKSMTTPDGKLERINKAFANMLGYTIEEMRTLNFTEITHKEDVAESKECVRCLLQGEKDSWKMQKRYFHKNGEVVWTSVTTRLQRDNHGNPLYFLTHIVDITEQKEYLFRLENEIEEHAAVEEELRVTNEELSQEIEQRKIVEERLRESQFQLGERVKEMKTLNELEKLMRLNLEDEEFLKSVVEIIPLGWTKPDITGVRIEVEEKIYQNNFYKADYPLIEEQISVNGKCVGKIAVSFGELDKNSPFLPEEIKLLKTIAAQIGESLESKRVDKILKDREQKLNSIATGAQVVLFSIDSNGIFTFSEGKGLEKLGLKPGQVVGLPINEVYENFPSIIEEAGRALKGEVVKSVIDLGELKFNTTWTPQFDKNGKVEQVIGVSYDITDLIEAEEALKKSEEKFRVAFNYASIGRAMAGPDGNFLNVNNAMCEMLGYSKNELLEKSWMDITHPDSLNDSLTMVEKLVKKEIQSAHYDCKFSHKNGTLVWVSLNIVLIFNDKGQPEFFIGDMENITDKKRFQEELRNSEKTFRNFVENVPVPLCNVKENGTIEYFNQQFIKTFGYNEIDLPTLDDWWKKAYPDEEYREWVIDNWTTAVNKAAEGDGEIRPDAYRVTCKNGAERTIIIGGVTIGSDFLATFNDITDQEKAQAELKESEHLYQITTEAANAGVWDWKVPTDEVYFSDVWKAQVGYKPNELENKFSTWSSLLHPEDSERCAKAVQEYLGNPEGNFILEFRMKHKDGSYRWIHNQAASFLDKNGKVARLFGIHSDITKRKDAEAQLRREINISDSIIDSTPGVFYKINTNAHFVRWNKNFENISGYSSEEMAKISPLDLFEGEEKEKVATAIKSVFETGYQEVEAEFVLRNGNKIPYLFTGTMKIIDDEPFLLGVGLDISKIREAHEKIKQSEKKLIKSMKELARSNKELEEFAYVASHDLQEPLRKVKNFTELLELKYKGQLDDKAAKYMEIITSGAERMQILINDLLTISRISTRGNEFELTDFNEVVEDITELLEMRITEENVTVNFSGLPELKVDKKQMGQLFQNLISNAIKFRTENSPVIDISASELGGEWQFCVKDNGIGFDMQFAEKIFVVFQRLHTRTEFEGTGIGLAICKKIIDRHNGKIWAKSTPGEGAEFYFTIPKNLK